MKLIIKIDNETYKGLVTEGHIFAKNIFDAVKNGTPIPDNATNGDVMKIIFPKIGVYDEWYDEPYQKGGKVK